MSPNKNRRSEAIPIKKSLLRFPLRTSLTPRVHTPTKLKSPKATSPAFKRLCDSPKTLAAKITSAAVSNASDNSTKSPLRARIASSPIAPQNHSPSDHKDDVMRRICQMYSLH
uniref:Uncharacterized protein n=1 Tax=Homalodisca liturata TaxID=320908 RepID=A0A1B6JVT0_9HEMI